jgi:hypothetical protein
MRGVTRAWCMRDWYFIAEQAAPAHPGGCAALRIVLVTVPRVSRSCEHFQDGFDLPLPRPLVHDLQCGAARVPTLRFVTSVAASRRQYSQVCYSRTVSGCLIGIPVTGRGEREVRC